MTTLRCKCFLHAGQLCTSSREAALSTAVQTSVHSFSPAALGKYPEPPVAGGLPALVVSIHDFQAGNTQQAVVWTEALLMIPQHQSLRLAGPMRASQIRPCLPSGGAGRSEKLQHTLRELNPPLVVDRGMSLLSLPAEKGKPLRRTADTHLTKRAGGGPYCHPQTLEQPTQSSAGCRRQQEDKGQVKIHWSWYQHALKVSSCCTSHLI